jgi:hypothetical protein
MLRPYSGVPHNEINKAMNDLQPPFFEHISSAQRVLLAGAGGGFDIYCGLPLYFSLRAAGKEVFLANLSFASLDMVPEIAPGLHEVKRNSRGMPQYFPELYLARWLETQSEHGSVFAFDRTGVKPLRHAYQVLIDQLQIDTIVLIDGGTDSLMRGDEEGLGTPEEDALSIAAVHTLETTARKYLVCLGFGVDAFHGVSHAHYLESVAMLTPYGHYLGAWSLTPNMPAFQKYAAAVEFASMHMPQHPSIVSSSIVDAVQGQFGDFHRTRRTSGSELFINPLMGLYWAFKLEGVAERLLYLDGLLETNTFRDVRMAIEDYRDSLRTTRPRKVIPH